VPSDSHAVSVAGRLEKGSIPGRFFRWTNFSKIGTSMSRVMNPGGKVVEMPDE
jgi:hypothetical protein